MTAQYLGLALFLFSVIVLACFSFFSIRPYCPSCVPRLAKTPLPRRAAAISRLRVQMGLTVGLGGAALWIILAARHGPDDAGWAYVTLATLLGYSLKG